MASRMTLGVLDWGIGGMFAAAHAMTLQPELNLLYRADTGNTPYGRQSRRELATSVQTALNQLADDGATHILIACHSASTALSDVIPPVPTWGVIDASSVPVDAETVLVLGGARTIRSGHWRRALVALPGQRRVIQRIAQPLSAHVEAGRADSDACLADLDRVLAPALDADCVVLACTHYAALADAITERMSAVQVDPTLSVVERLPLTTGTGRVQLDTSGDRTDLMRSARLALGARWPATWRGL